MQITSNAGIAQREVHRVPEPETVLVALAPPLVEARVVRVHLLPALAARRRLDRERAREGAERRGACHTNLRRAVGRRGTRSGRAAALIRQPQPPGQPACTSAQARLRADAQFEICSPSAGGVRSKLVVTTQRQGGFADGSDRAGAWGVRRRVVLGAGAAGTARGGTHGRHARPAGLRRGPHAGRRDHARRLRRARVRGPGGGATGGAGRPQHGRDGDHAGGGAQPASRSAR